MSATETTATNARVLGYDPLVDDGVNEEAMLTLVLPYIKTAKEGVQRLGALIEKYGTGESNSIAFNDHNDIWILETAGGHHWGAMRLPDETYAIVPNQTVVENLDLSDSDNYLGATDLAEFVATYHLNPTPSQFNFREIFGTHGEDDAYYNTLTTTHLELGMVKSYSILKLLTNSQLIKACQCAANLANYWRLKTFNFSYLPIIMAPPTIHLALTLLARPMTKRNTGQLPWTATSANQSCKFVTMSQLHELPFSGLPWDSSLMPHPCHSLPILMTHHSTTGTPRQLSMCITSTGLTRPYQL